MPLGSEHVEGELLVSDGAGLVFKHDDRGRWRLNPHSHEKMLVSQAKVPGMRSGYNRLDAKWIVFDQDPWGIASILIARRGEDSALSVASQLGANALNNERIGIAARREAASRMIILSAEPARQFET